MTTGLRIINNYNKSTNAQLAKGMAMQIVGLNRTAKAARDNDMYFIDFNAINGTRERNFTRIETRIVDYTAATEDASIYFYLRTAGAWSNPCSMTGTTLTCGTFSGALSGTWTGTYGTPTQYMNIGSTTTQGSEIDTNIRSAGTTLAASRTTAYRLLIDNQSTVVLTANNTYAGLLLQPKITEATSGQHRLISTVSIKPPQITSGVAQTRNASTLYISSETNAVIEGVGGGKNYAIWVNKGESLFEGNVTAWNYKYRKTALPGACNTVQESMTWYNYTNHRLYLCNSTKWNLVTLT